MYCAILFVVLLALLWKVALVMLATLHAHLARHHVEYLQFAFRWMNNLLMREMPLHCVIRLWDTYLVRICLIVLYVCILVIDLLIARGHPLLKTSFH